MRPAKELVNLALEETLGRLPFPVAIITVCMALGLLLFALSTPILLIVFAHQNDLDRKVEVGEQLDLAGYMIEPEHWTIKDNGPVEGMVTIVPTRRGVTPAFKGGIYYSQQKLLRVPEIRAHWKKDPRGISIRFILSPHAGITLHSYLKGECKKALDWEDLIEAQIVR